jgi:hypothetical protein
MNKLMWRIASNIEPAAESLYRAGTPGKWKISWELNRGLTRVATAGVDHRSEFCMQPAAGCTWTPGSMREAIPYARHGELVALQCAGST